MFHKWGAFAYRHRRIVPLVIITTIMALYVSFGMQLGDRLSQEGWDDPGSSSTAAAIIEAETFGRDSRGDVILLFRDEQGIEKSAQFSSIKEFLEKLKVSHPEQIKSITSYFEKRTPALRSEDGTTAFAAISLIGDGEQTLKDFRTILPSLSPTFPGVTVELAGATAVADALDAGMSGDIHRAELYALPAVGLLLLFVFGSVIAAFMPLIVGGLSILGSLGVLSVLAGFAQVNVFAQSVVTLLGLGLAIDYGLFMVSRFREELDQGASVEQAVRTTTATAGKTVVFSAAMVAVALSGLLIFPQAFLKSVAYGAMSAVGLAALLSVTVLPAIFGLVGTRINAFALRRTHVSTTNLASSLWYRIPARAMNKASLYTVAIVVGLIIFTTPLAGIKFGGINETYLPPAHTVRSAQTHFNETFPNFRTEPIKLVVTNATNEQLVSIVQQANAIPGLTGRFAPTAPTKDGTTILAAGITDRKYHEFVVKQLRDIAPPDGVQLYIGGTPALEVESVEALFDKLPWMALYVIVATFILMSLVFGSMILPAKAIIMTILGMGATLGILTAMFVDGIGGQLLGYSAGPLMSPVLVLIMAIVYGLSTDYEVFLLSRMVEAREQGKSTDSSIKEGTAHTGGIITAAALIMIVVCGAFGFSDIVMMKYIAFGMIFALLFDATFIRMLLVPAVMHLLREDNWWAPTFIKKTSRYLGHAAQPQSAGIPLQAESAESTTQPDSNEEATTEVTDESEQDSLIDEKESPDYLVVALPHGAAPAPALRGDQLHVENGAVRIPQSAFVKPKTNDDTAVIPKPADDIPEPLKASKPVTAEAAAPAESPSEATATEKETPIKKAKVIDRTIAGRSGRLVTEDEELVPFSELLKRLKEEG
ncbi:MMPL family transporter [Corynebacterium sp. HS2168-gen11]|uniref:MMPL family transporter n=1 Tax=Corynebacterium sp. HS2168-gen11 TaxID=2974027 RepID=UPI00216AE0B0|nr:MMPL family transporter [Corynebacterium sp. HS2168-gen11]MCS4535983.1 MMPL family transporter [Corynebacterium sp. HS2168-gen11]